MKYLDEYRDRQVAAKLADEIRRAATRHWVLMEVCGGQTHSIVKYGLDALLPENVELVHGPGCPVCVTSLEMIDRAHAIARQPDVIFCSFGDMLRVPGSSADLFKIKAEGGNVRVVYSPLDCLKIARANPDKQVVFFAIGFETTAPANAMAVWQAREQGISKFLGSGLACAGSAGDLRHSGVARQPRAGVSWTGSRVRYRRLDGIRADCGSLSRSDRDHRIRAHRHPARRADGCAATGAGACRTRERLFARRAPRRQSCGSADDRAGVPCLRSRLARHRRDSAEWFRAHGEFRQYDAGEIFGVETIQSVEPAVCISGASLTRLEEAARLSGFRQAMHARNSAGRDDGIGGGRLRGLLQLRPASGSGRIVGEGITGSWRRHSP